MPIDNPFISVHTRL